MSELTLSPVKTPEDVEWLRVQRNRPELYRYFRQDKPITEREQKLWWRGLDKNRVRLFIIMNGKDRVGYVGFNPFNAYASSAEFGIFIIPEHQGHGYGKDALMKLLKIGFEDYHLSRIYSDVLNYPGENRFDFYERLGFEKLQPHSQNFRYKKQGVIVPAIGFNMMRDQWEKLYGQNGKGQLEPVGAKAPGAKTQKAGKKGYRVHSGQDDIDQAPE